MQGRRTARLTAAAALALAAAGCGDRAADGVLREPTSARQTTATSSAPRGQTSCDRVIYVGESTSVGMVSPLQIPGRAERLESRMAAVGVRSLSVNVSGGRMTIGRLLDRPNAMDVLSPRVTDRFRGCYVVALGINDAAAVAALHSPAQIRQRIDMVLGAIGDRPVLWPLNVTSPRAPQFYDDAAMRAYDAGLREATRRYPKLRLYDWRAEMDPVWTEPDGVHDRRIGSRARALMYARALAVAFPAGRPMSRSAVVGSVPDRPASAANRPELRAEPGDRQAFWAADVARTTLYISGPNPGWPTDGHP